MPVSRIKITISRKRSFVRFRHLQSTEAASNFLSASSSNLSDRPCSFMSLTFGARLIRFRSSALRSIRLRVRNAQFYIRWRAAEFEAFDVVIRDLAQSHIRDRCRLQHPPAIAVIPLGLRFQPGISDPGEEPFRKFVQRTGPFRKRISAFHDLSEFQTRYLRCSVSFG